MASMYFLECDAQQIISHIINYDKYLESDKEKYNHAAIVIQSNFRGHLVRKEIKKFSVAANIIQKSVRGFLVRSSLAKYLLEVLESRAMHFYNKMALKIQALWRGYQVRIKVLDYYKTKAERLRMQKANEDLLNEMRKAMADPREAQEIEAHAKKTVLFYLFKIHHLLRTNQEGVLSIHNSKELSWIEKLLKSLRFSDYMKRIRNVYNACDREPPQKECMLEGRWKICEQSYYNRYRGDEKKPEKLRDGFYQEKPFYFNGNIKKDYFVSVLNDRKCIAPLKEVVRDADLERNISETPFDLTNKKAKPKTFPPDYHINFWMRNCNIHNIPD